MSIISWTILAPEKKKKKKNEKMSKGTKRVYVYAYNMVLMPCITSRAGLIESYDSRLGLYEQKEEESPSLCKETSNNSAGDGSPCARATPVFWCNSNKYAQRERKRAKYKDGGLRTKERCRGQSNAFFYPSSCKTIVPPYSVAGISRTWRVKGTTT